MTNFSFFTINEQIVCDIPFDKNYSMFPIESRHDMYTIIKRLFFNESIDNYRNLFAYCLRFHILNNSDSYRTIDHIKSILKNNNLYIKITFTNESNVRKYNFDIIEEIVTANNTFFTFGTSNIKIPCDYYFNLLEQFCNISMVLNIVI